MALSEPKCGAAGKILGPEVFLRRCSDCEQMESLGRESWSGKVRRGVELSCAQCAWLCR